MSVDFVMKVTFLREDSRNVSNGIDIIDFVYKNKKIIFIEIFVVVIINQNSGADNEKNIKNCSLCD